MPLETPRTYVNLTFEPEAPPRRRRRYAPVVAALVGLAALGVAGGFLLEPMFDGESPPAREAAAPAAERAPADGLDIVLDDRPPEAMAEPAPATADTSGIMPPAAEVAPAPAQPEDPRPAVKAPASEASPSPSPPTPAPPATRQAAQAAPRPAPIPPPAAPRTVETPPTPAYTPTPPPSWRAVRTTRPSFNCRYARTVSEQMVCTDPGLATADRRLARAYHQAIRRGIPEPELRRQQDIWLGVRESAARAGPEGVARAYAERTAQLQAMAR
ncbi:MAG TPA: hypothetical protein VFX95_08240 [Caulobacteraceae bacterium]|nr:hypothetical protein [Caulobacteraceae bacterium]